MIVLEMMIVGKSRKRVHVNRRREKYVEKVVKIRPRGEITKTNTATTFFLQRNNELLMTCENTERSKTKFEMGSRLIF